MRSTERLEEVADELARLSESLADLAMESLRGALEEGEEGGEAALAAVREEKVLNRARSSLDKAVRLLRSLSAGTAGDEEPEP